VENLSPGLVYALLGLSSFIENLMPPFPGDTITLFGAYLAGLGLVNPFQVFGWTATGNLFSNLIIYYLGLRNGRSFIKKHHRLFHPELLPRVALFYRKCGMGMIFASRFLVGFRSMVPLFAGISRLRLSRFLPPLICSIIVQHALLVYLGFSVGQNWEYIKKVLKNINLGLGIAALVLAAVIFFWFRSVLRHSRGRVLKKEERRKWLKIKRGG
jgi:membrane protein DedA with SNARE-associated domain